MIEVPRGALTADEIAAVTAEFFTDFGTNDLTQMALGISRDDMGNFLMPYVENDIFKKNPFATLDQTGVGQLMKMAIDKGRSSRPNIKLGICGEHGGDPDSVKFCHTLLGLNYVSCSPFRVPVARLAAAQAAIEEEAGRREEEVQAPSPQSSETDRSRSGRKAGAAFFARNPIPSDLIPIVWGCRVRSFDWELPAAQGTPPVRPGPESFPPTQPERGGAAKFVGPGCAALLVQERSTDVFPIPKG